MQTHLKPKVTELRVRAGRHTYRIDPEDAHALVHINGILQRSGRDYIIEDDLLVLFCAPAASDSVTLLRLQ